MCAREEICVYIDWLSFWKCISELIARELIGGCFIFNRNIFPRREMDPIMRFYYGTASCEISAIYLSKIQSNLAVQL